MPPRRIVRSRPLVALVLAGALAGAAPVAHWCRLDWDRIPREILAACLAGRPLPAGACALAEPTASACRHRGTCRFAPGRQAACPLRDGSSGAVSGARPRHERARACGLDDPMFARALRSSAPSPLALPALTAVPAGVQLAAPEPVRRLRAPVRQARPPTAAPESRPPVRGPPSLLG